MNPDKANIGLETVTKSVDGFLTPDMAKTGQITLTKIGQSNQINDQFLIELFSRKELVRRKIERFKTEIERFYWREEYGFSTRDCLTEIALSYDEITTELGELVDSFEDQIGQAGEIDWEEELYEIVKYLIGLKSKNIHIFRKIILNSDKSSNHKKSRTTQKNLAKR